MPRKKKDPNVENIDNPRRDVIKTLGLGLSLAALPAFISAKSVEISSEALDHGESIIPLEERDLVEMQKFIEDCITANKDSNPQEAVKEVLAKEVSNTSQMLKAIGHPTEAGLKVFLRSKDLTIFAASWTPQMNLMPHNHLMWANIAIYTGREDNILWKRTAKGLEANKAKCLFEGDVAMLNANAIHSVTNPLKRFTGGIHIYGGDFFATERSQWDPETLDEEPSNGDVIKNIFKEANEQLRNMKKH
ncbi:hypothetical protein [Aestuariibaculum lutulentum]|uniref:Aspartyl/asparaginy/proline hydroxylase domain-containing protein n=1 Tax=Aestuariibaculum lutulentum TaxID=2920935 RepID=A0ABS9RKL1_9FLAO|nr:hypothetical protein [Aestuariibaculum lutulentum]MCH4553480.1 hypothetical protein [Aestuariibaculum lutulentum]